MFYSNEALLNKNAPAIETFWQDLVTTDYLTTEQGKLFYAFHIPYKADFAIVLSAGRSESAEKYQELIWELARNNIAVFILDHQGQGRSYRLIQDSQKGHVTHFSHYKNDFAQFDTRVVNKHWQGKKILLAHSMGGAIAYDYISQTKHNYRGLFLSAPMFAINTGKTPVWAARLSAGLLHLTGQGQRYCLGQQDYNPPEFDENPLTHSPIRYQRFRQLYTDQPSLQLGGVTHSWLHSALSLCAKLPKRTINIPVFIAAAEKDTIVNTAIYPEFLQHHAILKTYQGAKHELLFEQDNIRRNVLKDLLDFANEC